MDAHLITSKTTYWAIDEQALGKKGSFVCLSAIALWSEHCANKVWTMCLNVGTIEYNTPGQIDQKFLKLTPS